MDFSVELLHTVEKDMDSEMVKLMKAMNVSSITEISQKSLESTLNKKPLSTFLSSMVKLYEKNKNICKLAAVKLDSMKDEKIELQRQLIDAKNDQAIVTSVQKTVKNEMQKSWADVAKKNIAQSKTVTAKTIKEAVRAVNDEEERSKNLIVYGVQEAEEGDWEDVLSNDVLDQVVKSIHEATVADGSFPGLVKAYRLGKKETNKTRPIKVEFDSSSEVDMILRQAHKLKANSEFKTVYLSPDRTKEQRLAHSKLVKQMKEMINQDKTKHYFIRNNKITSVNKE